MRPRDFSAATNGGGNVSLSDFKGRNVILYFYPKDDTPGCTKEACNFRDHFSEFEKRGAVVLGVSTDPAKSHDKFVEKFKLPFTLLADEDKKIVQAYGVWGEKSFMGRKVHGDHARDVFDRRRRTDPEDLAEGQAGRTRPGNLRGALIRKFSGPQKLDGLADDFAVAHDKWMRRVNDPEIAHAREPGAFHGYLPVIRSGNKKQAVNPIDGTVAGDNTDGIMAGLSWFGTELLSVPSSLPAGLLIH